MTFLHKSSGTWVDFVFLLPNHQRYLVNRSRPSDCSTHVGALPSGFPSQDPTSPPYCCRILAAHFSKEIFQGHPRSVPLTFIFLISNSLYLLLSLLPFPVSDNLERSSLFQCSSPCSALSRIPAHSCETLICQYILSFYNLNLVASYHMKMLRSFWSFRVGFLNDWLWIFWAPSVFYAG